MLVKLIKTDMTEKYFGYPKQELMEVGRTFDSKMEKKTWVPAFYLSEDGYMYHADDVEEVKNALQELERFQTDRLLHNNPFDLRIATMNILEELLEAHGVGDNKDRDLVTMLYEEFETIISAIFDTIADDGDMDGVTYSEPTIEDQVDAFCDIQVFAGGEIGKLGYSNEQCLIEVGKEINSRTGEIVNGKFEKYKTEEAMAKWYKANFSGCKLRI